MTTNLERGGGALLAEPLKKNLIFCGCPNFYSPRLANFDFPDDQPTTTIITMNITTTTATKTMKSMRIMRQSE